MFNYTQYMYSITPEEEPGGGGYAVLIESLGSLWEDFEHLRNIWTHSNAGLPLVRYYGCTLYFYQSEHTDYVVEIKHCLPMKDYQYTHADTSPNRMLLKRYTIKVPSRQTRKKRKPYKKVRVPPPSQMTNKWYFQKDICNIPLVMVLASACSFTKPFGSDNWQSNNLTLICLDTTFWQRNNFNNVSATVGYFPKPNFYLYTDGHHYNLSEKKPTRNLIYLGNTDDNRPGVAKSYSELKNSKKDDWGNPFYHNYLNPEEVTIWSSQYPPSQLPNTAVQDDTFQQVTTPYFIKCRYNPEKDKGTNNLLYMVSNIQDTTWTPPENPHINMSGLPLYDIIFGYIDWNEKIHEVQQILNTQIIVFRSDCITPKLPQYVVIDREFIDGFSAYKTSESTTQVTDYDKQHWHPRSKNQLRTLNKMALCGQHSPHYNYETYLQAQMGYNFKFKWGGCPKTLEKPYDPCSQPDWIIPSNITQGLQIQNPETNPATELYKFDWRRDFIKKTAIQRIKNNEPLDELLQLFTESRHNADPLAYPPQTSSSETETEEEKEEQTSLQTQIQQLRKQQRKLKHRILFQLTQQKLQ